MSLRLTEAVFDFRNAGSLILKGRRQLAVLSAAGIVIGFASSFLLPREFVASTSFVPVGSNALTQPSDLLRSLSLGQASAASVLGVGAAPADIYPDLLASSRLLRDALSKKTAQVGGATAKTFQAEFGFGRGDSAIQMSKAIKFVRRRMHVSVSRTNGLVNIQFRFGRPQLSASFLNDLLNCLNDFNTNVRQSQAGGVRRFLERRIADARVELDSAENDLTAFRLRNLRYQNSPRLALAEARLQRQVRLAESIYQTLTNQFELARIDEARDTPTLTIVEPPVPPALPSGIGPFGRLALGGLVGLSVASAWVLRGAWSSGDV